MEGIKYNSYNVMLFDFNKKCVVAYDIMPYLISTWKEEKKRKNKVFFGKNYDKTYMPKTFDDIKQWILHASQYQFWSRCEYEFIASNWPGQQHEEKIDAYKQIEFNIDVLTNHFMKEIKRRK